MPVNQTLPHVPKGTYYFPPKTRSQKLPIFCFVDLVRTCKPKCKYLWVIIDK